MTRRALFAALASLPFVGRFAPVSLYRISRDEYESAMRRHLAEHRRMIERDASRL